MLVWPDKYVPCPLSTHFDRNPSPPMQLFEVILLKMAIVDSSLLLLWWPSWLTSESCSSFLPTSHPSIGGASQSSLAIEASSQSSPPLEVGSASAQVHGGPSWQRPGPV